MDLTTTMKHSGGTKYSRARGPKFITMKHN